MSNEQYYSARELKSNFNFVEARLKFKAHLSQ